MGADLHATYSTYYHLDEANPQIARPTYLYLYNPFLPHTWSQSNLFVGLVYLEYLNVSALSSYQK